MPSLRIICLAALLCNTTTIYASLTAGVSSGLTGGFSEPPVNLEPPPTCEVCPTIDQLVEPGIGFALELGYGTAVVRYHNGTYENIAQVEGDDAYTELMARYATGPQPRIPDHFEYIENNWDRIRYVMQRLTRLLNKQLGFPATKDVAVLATMVEKLAMATRDSVKIGAIVLSSPDQVYLTYEELGDIFDYLDLRNRLLDKNFGGTRRLFSMSAAYTGAGYGLCKDYLNMDYCELEEYNLPREEVLYIDFSKYGLSASIRSMQQSFDLASAVLSFTDPELGMRDSLDDDFWNAVRSRIETLVKAYYTKPTLLVLTGPSACDATFRSVVKNLFERVSGEDMTRTLDSDCTDLPYTTARGAAEIAKRRQEGPVSCVDTDECEKRRESQRSSTHERMVVQVVA